jgi:hypothetical protein
LGEDEGAALAVERERQLRVAGDKKIISWQVPGSLADEVGN